MNCLSSSDPIAELSLTCHEPKGLELSSRTLSILFIFWLAARSKESQWSFSV